MKCKSTRCVKCLVGGRYQEVEVEEEEEEGSVVGNWGLSLVLILELVAAC
jgi:hypothetical protein